MDRGITVWKYKKGKSRWILHNGEGREGGCVVVEARKSDWSSELARKLHQATNESQTGAEHVMQSKGNTACWERKRGGVKRGGGRWAKKGGVHTCTCASARTCTRTRETQSGMGNFLKLCKRSQITMESEVIIHDGREKKKTVSVTRSALANQWAELPAQSLYFTWFCLKKENKKPFLYRGERSQRASAKCTLSTQRWNSSHCRTRSPRTCFRW